MVCLDTKKLDEYMNGSRRLFLLYSASEALREALGAYSDRSDVLFIASEREGLPFGGENTELLPESEFEELYALFRTYNFSDSVTLLSDSRKLPYPTVFDMTRAGCLDMTEALRAIIG